MKVRWAGAVIVVVAALAVSACSSTVAPTLNPVPYYTYYPAPLPTVVNAAERALPAAGMRFTGTKAENPNTIEIKGFTASGDAVLITLHRVGAAVTKFDARIGLFGHLQEVQEIEYWMGKYVGQAVSQPGS